MASPQVIFSVAGALLGRNNITAATTHRRRRGHRRSGFADSTRSKADGGHGYKNKFNSIFHNVEWLSPFFIGCWASINPFFPSIGHGLFIILMRIGNPGPVSSNRLFSVRIFSCSGKCPVSRPATAYSLIITGVPTSTMVYSSITSSFRMRTHP